MDMPPDLKDRVAALEKYVCDLCLALSNREAGREGMWVNQDFRYPMLKDEADRIGEELGAKDIKDYGRHSGGAP